MAMVTYADASIAPIDTVVPFTPVTLFGGSDTGYFFDFSDISTLFQDAGRTVPVTASGQTVGSVTDKSGKGHHLTQATVGARPTYIEDAGKKFLRFATNKMLLSATAQSFVVSTVDFMAVARETTEVVSAGIFVEGVPNTNDWTTPQGFITGTSTTGNIAEFGGYSFAMNLAVAGTGAMPKSNLEVRKAGTVAQAFRNGAQVGSNVTVVAGTSVANAQLVVGARMLAAGPGTYFFNGDIGGVFRIGRTLDVAERNNLRTYMDALL